MFLIPFSGSSLLRRLWRSCREKSRETELRPFSCSIDKDSSGNSSNFLSASNTTYVPGSSGNLTVHTHTHTQVHIPPQKYNDFHICKQNIVLYVKPNVPYINTELPCCVCKSTCITSNHIYSNNIFQRGVRFSLLKQKTCRWAANKQTKITADVGNSGSYDTQKR